ncbi:hypothetical protein OFN32_30925, partial [Escherichia coli]|nr:hypothetical protein [Escherichia coli]
GEGACAILWLRQVHLQVLVVGVGKLNATCKGDVVRDGEFGGVDGGDEQQGGNEEAHEKWGCRKELVVTALAGMEFQGAEGGAGLKKPF